MRLHLSALSSCLILMACPAAPVPDGGTGGGGGEAAVVNVTADITADTTWTKANRYVLKQLTYVASGTATEPIVFTSSLPVGQRGSPQGDWGGLVFLGRAVINTMGG